MVRGKDWADSVSRSLSLRGNANCSCRACGRCSETRCRFRLSRSTNGRGRPLQKNTTARCPHTSFDSLAAFVNGVCSKLPLCLRLYVRGRVWSTRLKPLLLWFEKSA